MPYTVRTVLALAVGFLWVGGSHTVQSQTPVTPGSPMPAVQDVLERPDGSAVAPRQLAGSSGVVFLIWNPDCPWVDRYEDRLRALAAEYEGQGLRFVLVDAAQNGSDDTASTQIEAAIHVQDPRRRFIDALGATRTPQAFVFDAERTLTYMGAIDDSPSSPERVEERYLRAALRALVEDQNPEPHQQRSAFGCRLRTP